MINNVIKLGNTWFKADLGKDVPFSEFKKVYTKLLKDIPLEEAYKRLGGKLDKKKED